MDTTPTVQSAPSSPNDAGDAPPALPRQPKRLIVRLVVALVILAALVVAGRRYYGELARLKSASPWLIAAMAALYVAGRLPATWVMRASLRALGHQLGRAETFFVLMVQYYVNMLIP